MKARRWVLGLVLLQGALVGLYLGIERARRPEAPFSWERMDAPAPALQVQHGETPVSVPEGPHLVHFWATWCAPCKAELPMLIEAAEAEGVPLLAITDEPWPVVERYFGGEVPAAIVRDPSGDAAARWEVSGLPDTYVVQQGRQRGRMGGPRDWSSRGAREFLQGLE